ncbi:MAG: hypothetical protein DWI58_20405 [Chloroflexi bacterium]|nr:MAG: hypothetical protein DWI58_20405 [Chloroflexota bacterium]
MTSGAPGTPVPGPLSPEGEYEVLKFFSERLARPVGLDVWTRAHTGLVLTDRDNCEHCDEQLALMRQFVRLTPMLTVTPYDLDRHASRAAEAGVEMTPTTIMRCGGRSIQYVGMAGGMLFPALLDVLSYLSIGSTPLDDSSRMVLATLTAPIRVELLVAPYDNYSAHLMRLVSALATESRLIRLRIIDATEYPMYSSLRAVEGVPVLYIEGQRFIGVWDEAELLEQIWRIANGDTDLVPRSAVYAVPFITEAEARQLEVQSVGDVPNALGPADPPSTPGGLYIPGR